MHYPSTCASLLHHYVISCSHILVHHYVISCTSHLLVQYYVISCSHLLVHHYVISCTTNLLVHRYVILYTPHLLVHCYVISCSHLLVHQYCTTTQSRAPRTRAPYCTYSYSCTSRAPLELSCTHTRALLNLVHLVLVYPTAPARTHAPLVHHSNYRAPILMPHSISCTHQAHLSSHS